MFKPAEPGKRKEPIPFLKFPYKSLESQMISLLQVPGIEEALETWRTVPRQGGDYHDIFDGAIPKELKCATGEKFFRNDPVDKPNGPAGELRIGLTLGVDWFSYLRSQIAPSHSSCPMSFNIANLPPHLRYRTSNLLLTGIMPGPIRTKP